MPQYQQTLSVAQYTPDQSLQMAYGCFQQLGWTVEYVFPGRLVGYSRKKWNSYYDHIIVEAEEGALTITSKLPGNAVWDMMGRNKKNVKNLIGCFESLHQTGKEASERWASEMARLQQQTEEAVVQEQKDAAEVESVMNLSSGSRTVTYALIALNVIVFIMMAVSGVGIFDPSTADILKWGGNFKPYTIGGEWWRLITNVFVHIGIIHIAFNMYALFYVGLYLEPLLGKIRYAIAYLCTGIFASLTSLWWHHDPIVSAGASGAIFGLYGVFLALLTTKLIPDKVRTQMLGSIGIFVGYNLLYGMKSGVDNAAHVGGLISGFITGYIYFLSLRNNRFRPMAAASLVLALTAVFTFSYLKSSRDDTVAYQKKLERLGTLEEEAIEPLQRKNISEEDLSWAMTHTAQIKWQEAKKLMEETESYQLPQVLSKQREILKEYVDLRIKQTDLIVLALNKEHDKDVEADLQKVTQEINEKQKAIEALH